jgi:hypothetical protein
MLGQTQFPQADILIGASDRYARVSSAFHEIRGALDSDVAVRVLRICAWVTHITFVHAEHYPSATQSFFHITEGHHNLISTIYCLQESWSKTWRSNMHG